MLSQDPYAFRDLWRPDDPVASEKALQALMLSAKATGDPTLVSQILAYIGHAQALQQRFEEAHDALNDADFILIPQKPHAAHARALLERGRIFLLSGLESSGHKYIELARLKAEEVGARDLLDEIVKSFPTGRNPDEV